jgi:nucleoside-diphosphate-sugar epimerase
MNDSTKDKLVLVTGGTGFVAVHCIAQLLEKGYQVRTTVRSTKRTNEVTDMLRVAGIHSFENLSFVETDLLSDTNWDVAVEGCDYVLHVASPIYLGIPKDENEMIRPAVEGTLRVLKAAREAGVKRVVMTSNFGAVGYSHTDTTKVITEESWTNPDEHGLSTYNKSKVMAEKAAWEFMKNEGGVLQLSVINPVGIFGPAFTSKLSSGFELLKRILDGSMKAIPNMTLNIVDVRDLVDLHIRAMTCEAANGERFLALSDGVMTLPEIAAFLKSHLGEKGDKISTRKMPDWLVEIAALFNPQAKALVPMLSRYRDASNEKAKGLLGWQPRSKEEALLATADSLFKFNLSNKE